MVIQFVGIIVLRRRVQQMWVLQTLVQLASPQLASVYLLTAYFKNAQESLSAATQLCRVTTMATFQMVNFVSSMELVYLKIPQWSKKMLKHVTLVFLLQVRHLYHPFHHQSTPP